MDALDKDIFPIVKNIVYEILHKLHRHQRENYLKKKSLSEQDEQNQRKHRNCHRSKKRKRRTKMIEKLQETKDTLVRKFSERELWPLKIINTILLSPEDSETDQSNPSGDRMIDTKDLKWRSDICYEFLKIFEESSKAPRRRSWTCGRSYAPNEGTAPLNAPKWSRSGYNGSLKKGVDKSIRIISSDIRNNPTDDNNTIE